MSFHLDPDELKREMAEMPGHMADICRRVAEARNTEALSERNYKLIRYVRERDIRDLYRNSPVFDKKPTEDAIKMEVALAVPVRIALEELSNAESALRLLEAELQAYNCKRDMLVSLSAYVRTELETIRFSNAR